MVNTEGAAFSRRNWPTAPDGFHIAVPRTWALPGSAPISSAHNKDLAEGALRAEKARVTSIVCGDVHLGASLFSASGTLEDGARAGVSIGVFDTGSPATLSSLRQEILAVTPERSTEDVTVTRLAGLRVRSASRPRPVGEPRIVSDYWVRVPHCPAQVAVVRFWTDASGDSPELKELENFMIGSFSLILPAHWAGVQRKASMYVYKAIAENEQPTEAWRLGGWRLGRTFATAPVRDTVAASLSQANAQPRHVVPLVLIWVAWLAAALAMFGLQPGLLIPGTVGMLMSTRVAQKSRTAVIGLAALLAILLLVGVGLDAG